MTVAYNRGKARIATTGWPNLDVRALVLAGASVPGGAESATLNTVADLMAIVGVVEAVETTGLTGYIRKALAETVVEDDTAGQANLDAADLAYAATNSGTWRAIVFYAEGGGTDATRDLITLHTITPLTTNGGAVDVAVPANGAIGVA